MLVFTSNNSTSSPYYNSTDQYNAVQPLHTLTHLRPAYVRNDTSNSSTGTTNYTSNKASAVPLSWLPLTAVLAVAAAVPLNCYCYC
jgi:hypothetical protein